MSVEQKETGLNSQNLGELVNQYKQIEQAFNTRIAEIVKNVLPKDFDMSNLWGIDTVFQELHSPQNLRKEGILNIRTNHFKGDDKELFSTIFNGLDGRLFDERIGMEVSRMGNTITISVIILPENVKTHEVEIAVGDMVASVDGILDNLEEPKLGEVITVPTQKFIVCKNPYPNNKYEISFGEFSLCDPQGPDISYASVIIIMDYKLHGKSRKDYINELLDTEAYETKEEQEEQIGIINETIDNMLNKGYLIEKGGLLYLNVEVRGG